VIAVLTWWQSNQQPEPLKRIEVRMISAQELRHLQHQEIAKPKHIQKHAKAAPKVLKKTPKVTQLKAKPKVQQAESDFDPFAPVESSSNSKKHTKKQKDIADIMGKQLSKQEIDRYIAIMQAAVQKHWKVPGGLSENTPAPLVEMILRRDGSLISVRILESSGHAALDQTLITAIRAAAPFNIPRQQFESFQNNQIRFHPL